MPVQDAQIENTYLQSDVDVDLKGPNGAPITGPAVVTLIKMSGQVYDQQTAKNGRVRFNGVSPSEYTIQVVAPAYEGISKKVDVRERTLAKVSIDLTPLSDPEQAVTAANLFALNPKVQKDVGKALEELRTNKLNDARKHLDAAFKAAPTSAEIVYLLGVYSSQTKDPARANSYWMKALELDPKHLSALLSISFDLLQQNKAADATPYLTRAVAAEPSSWRAHALLAEAYILQSKHDDAVKQAERAIELGHERAVSVQPVLARALAESGDREQATKILEAYVKAHPTDVGAKKDLDILKNPQVSVGSGITGSAAEDLAAMGSAATALPVVSNWLPPDVDEKVPPVEPGASCQVDDVVRKAGKQITELVGDVDRFSATESLTHESINKYGLPSAPEKRRFDYVVSIQEVQRGFLNVEEYRINNSSGPGAQFPDGVATNGLPALVLIFHPYIAPNFEMACEGLARWSGGLAWQVHFKQRPDKPNVIKRYRVGVDGPSYPVALKGRAWISAENFQIVRLETDLVAPMPQIRLVADHAEIEYGPVKFRDGKINMWLPQSAEVYYDWKGRRIHRRHSFSNYMLFAVDDRQRISTPKVAEVPPEGAPGEAQKEKP